MIKGFKEFLMRGNIVDLAIAVVIGGAFGAVVSAFVSAIVKPIIAALPGASVNGWGFSIRHGDLTKPTFIDISAVLNALIVFVLTAAVVYFVFVVPMTRMQEMRARRLAAGEPADAAVVPTDEVLLLTEIRDLLYSQNPGATAGASGAAPLA